MEKLNLKPTIDDDISIKYQGELMENYFPESIIDSGKGIKALMYDSDKAMVFFIDNDHSLNLIINIDDTESGWVNYKLSPAQMEANAFDIYHDKAANNLRIVYSGTNNNNSTLWVSNNIELGKIDPKHFDDFLSWEPQTLNDSSRLIDHISINNQGVLYSTSYKTSDATYAYFKYGEGSVAYTLPENTEKVIQLEVGQVYDEFGTFLLYEMKGGQTMLFQSFPDEEYGEVYQKRFSTGAQINAFSTLDNDKGNSILYLAGDGLFKFDEPESDKQTISKSGQGINYTRIVTASNEKETSLWTIGEKGNKGLYYCTDRFYESSTEITDKWTTPLMMHDNVEDFTCIKGNQLLNQLFLFGNDGGSNGLIHFWQDKVTTVWNEHPVQIEALTTTKKIETFTLNVQFSFDSSLRSFHGEKVTISAESNLSVYVNGRRTTIGPENSFDTLIDGDQINIVYPTKSIASPLLFVQADFINEKVEVDPAHKLKKELKAKFSDKDALRNARKQNGKPLIAGGVSDDELEQVAAATDKIFAHLESTKSDGQPNAAASVQLAALSTTGQALTSGDIFTEIGNAIGDVWYAVKKGFIEVTEFIVETVEYGVKFIIKIGQEIFEWISEKVSDVFHFLERVWEKIKVFFKDVFEYLAFLFNWGDILDTKNALKDMLNNGFDVAENSIDGIKEKVTGVADQLQIMLDSPELTSQFKTMGKFSEYQQKANDIKKEQKEDYSADPRANWISSKKENLARADMGAASADETSVPDDDLNIFAELVSDLKKVWKEIESQFYALMNDEITVGDFLKVLVQKVAALIVEVLEDLINALLTFVQKTIGAAKDALNAEIDIPFFTALYKEYIDPAGPSVMDIMCLVVAVPFTATYKIMAGKAPVEDGLTKYLAQINAINLVEKDESFEARSTLSINVKPTALTAMSISPAMSNDVVMLAATDKESEWIKEQIKVQHYGAAAARACKVFFSFIPKAHALEAGSAVISDICLIGTKEENENWLGIKIIKNLIGTTVDATSGQTAEYVAGFFDIVEGIGTIIFFFKDEEWDELPWYVIGGKWGDAFFEIINGGIALIPEETKVEMLADPTGSSQSTLLAINIVKGIAGGVGVAGEVIAGVAAPTRT